MTFDKISETTLNNLSKQKISYNEFHVSRVVRDACNFPLPMFASFGNVILGNLKNVRQFAAKLNELFVARGEPNAQVSAGSLNAMGLLDEIFHFASMMYRKTKCLTATEELLADLIKDFGEDKINELLLQFTKEFPPTEVYTGKISAEDFLNQESFDIGTNRPRSNKEATLEELILLHLANENPAFKPFKIMFNDEMLSKNPLYAKTWVQTKAYFKKLPYWGMFGNDLINFLKEPVNFAPESLRDQLEYVRTHWADLLGEWLARLLSGIDVLNEEYKPKWAPGNGGSPDMSPYSYDYLQNEYERFSADSEWMPRVVLMAKTVLVWLDQLSKKYGWSITRLDQIPDQELDTLRDQGFTGLWLIGLWQRSEASSKIKKMCGNPEAAASAYSLKNYEIADNLGGWGALENLRGRLWVRGIRLASDMVPNHTGMDSTWITERPDLFMQRRDNPFPQYTFNGANLSNDGRVSIFLEDHYYSKNDCAVVFKRVDNYTGDTRYIYHGNDGTGLPWNDTAQIDFLNPEAREAVMQEILHVARNFPIIRFDAAMVLAKKHIKRLWYPEPGRGGDIATRSEYALTGDQFENAIPNEFWREVVDRVAREVPDTLLLAEAFWMMEGYFTRTLGMHRVYNSAFMNMLKKEENQKYRDTVKNTIQFDPQVLKRFVNFMNNPDEETAIAQFGNGDKYFGVCTLMSTMPGLPMFGHGQIEGFTEKYGMEYMKAYYDEKPDQYLIDRHWREIFPLLKKRYLFAEMENFLFYDVWTNDGWVNENIFAYSNRFGDERAVVFYNNKYERASGWIKQSCQYAQKTGNKDADGNDEKIMITRTLSEGLGIGDTENDFVIFREQRSGLCYIRTNKEICEKGLFVSLNGFESQVLMDFRFESDGANSNGKWRTLYNFLNGAGTPDIDIAWQEYHYRELYDAFKKIFTDELFTKLDAISMSESSRKAEKIKYPTADEICKIVEKDAITFYKMAEKFAEEDLAVASVGEALEPLEAKAKKVPSRASGTKATLLPKDEAQFKNFKATVTALLKMYKTKTNKVLFPPKAKSLEEYFQFSPHVFESAVEMFVTYSLIEDIAKAGYAELWSLDRKIAEFVKEVGVQNPNIQVTAQRMFKLAKIPTIKFTDAKSEKLGAWNIVNEVVGSGNSYLLAATNDYNGIKWFNKELTALSVYTAFAMQMLEANVETQKKLLALYKKVYDAKEKAEYQAAKFEAPFAPPAPKKSATKATLRQAQGPKTTAKSAAKASTAKKTVSKTAKTADKKVEAKSKKTAEKKPAKTEKTASKRKK